MFDIAGLWALDANVSRRLEAREGVIRIPRYGRVDNVAAKAAAQRR